MGLPAMVNLVLEQVQQQKVGAFGNRPEGPRSVITMSRSRAGGRAAEGGQAVVGLGLGRTQIGGGVW